MEVRKKMKEANEEWIEEQGIIIDKEMSAGSSKKAYSIPKILTKTSQSKASVISDADEISLPRVLQFLTGRLNTVVPSTTT
ncbi:hypothetical protein DPMN_050337 [Dreissena polymorpha]|uniref:Uncharacterized protein n=1 Tax=Dreissena polymorpha TaxID=45954 RepID=A0A9D4CFX5_DREPO|nr:hypothetical protein DPMN_050337 [Dreissena polymorpha]